MSIRNGTAISAATAPPSTRRPTSPRFGSRAGLRSLRGPMQHVAHGGVVPRLRPGHSPGGQADRNVPLCPHPAPALPAGTRSFATFRGNTRGVLPANVANDLVRPLHRGHPARPSTVGRISCCRAPRSAGYPRRVLDLKLLRDDPDAVRASQRARGEDDGLVDDLLRRRRATPGRDRRASTALRAEQKELGTPGRQGAAATSKAALLARTKDLSAEVKAAEAAQTEAAATYDALLRQLSNIVEDGRAGRRRGRLRRARARRRAAAARLRAARPPRARRAARRHRHRARRQGVAARGSTS